MSIFKICKTINIFSKKTQNINMKRIICYLFFNLLIFSAIFCGFFNNTKLALATNNTPIMSIVIDDFGSWDESGVDKLLSLHTKITCAVIPNVDNTKTHSQLIENGCHELILHMPMQSHVNLPESWYGPVYIKNTDSPEEAIKKLETCLAEFPNVKGFNIHIGSGVSQNKTLMKAIYDYANKKGLYFLDSRTIETKATEEACSDSGSIYLGRDVFLEPNKNRSYSGVQNRLLECANIAIEKGYAIAIGHVGAEGGENTANAIADTIPLIEKMGVKIVPLSEIYEKLKSEHYTNN